MVATIPLVVGSEPIGIAIQSALRFAGTPGQANCFGQSVAALVTQFGGLNAAAAALGFTSVGALQNALLTFCEG